MVPVARRNLLADKVRFIVSIGGVTFAVMLVLVVRSLYQGYYRGTGAFVDRMPVDVWVSEPGANGTLLSSMLPVSSGNQLTAVGGVQSILPMNRQLLRLDHEGDAIDTVVLSFDLPESTGEQVNVPIPPPGGITIDNASARKYGVEIGDHVSLRGHTLVVRHITSSVMVGLTGVAIISWQDGQALLSPPGYVSSWMVTVKPGASVPSVIKAINAQVADVQAVPNTTFAAANRNNISSHFLPIITVLVFVSFLVGCAVVGVTIYTATTERLREYGVLKAIGASMLLLIRVVIEQSVLVCATGFVLGIPATYVVNRVAGHIVPDFITQLRWQDVALALIVVLAMAVVAAVIPIRRLASLDPADVFRA